MELKDLSVEQLCGLLQTKGFGQDVIGVIRKHKVDGYILVDLDDDDMTDIGIEAWGDRRRLRKLISSDCSRSLPLEITVTPRKEATTPRQLTLPASPELQLVS